MEFSTLTSQVQAQEKHEMIERFIRQFYLKLDKQLKYTIAIQKGIED